MNLWYKNWFDSEYYLKVYEHRDHEDAQKLGELILKNININSSASVLDAACGAGRYAKFFAEKGFNVVGFDLSNSLLKIAAEESKGKKYKLNLIRADKRQIFFKTKFDLVVNLFTSFGYFETDEENFAFCKNIYQSLSDDGFYILDYFNKDFLEMHLVQHSKKKYEDFILIEERKIYNDKVEKRITIHHNEKENNYYESVKLYSFEFISKYFQKIGYKLIKMLGDYNGGKFSKKESPRLILFFQK
jgi:SAM-dependent methyltransferase